MLMLISASDIASRCLQVVSLIKTEPIETSEKQFHKTFTNDKWINYPLQLDLFSSMRMTRYEMSEWVGKIPEDIKNIVARIIVSFHQLH